jgi:hypothetical protein
MEDNMSFCKLEIFIPKSHLKQLQVALQRVDAGHIGNYDSCLSYSDVIGVWRPINNAKPYIGELNQICEEPEVKVEVIVLSDNLEQTLSAIKEIHPYEVPVINIIPLLNTL